MRVLRQGMSGPDVRRWEYFLVGQTFYPGEVDGAFDEQTYRATVAFQQANRIEPVDGIVGNRTLGKALTFGFGVLTDDDLTENSSNWPPRPSFKPLTSTAARQRLFGKFAYRANGDGSIVILDDWAKENIVRVHIPQLTGVKGAPRDCTVQFHQLGAEQLRALFAAWERAGLIKLLLTWGGSFVPRMVRGSLTNLSNHAFATAFDVNVAWNQLGCLPALVGREGSVREMVPLANEHGFYWGGHYEGRKDGMHFELALIK